MHTHTHVQEKNAQNYKPRHWILVQTNLFLALNETDVSSSLPSTVIFLTFSCKVQVSFQLQPLREYGNVEPGHCSLLLIT